MPAQRTLLTTSVSKSRISCRAASNPISCSTTCKICKNVNLDWMTQHSSHLSFTARQHMSGQVDIEGLSIGGESVVACDLLGNTGDKHARSRSSYRCKCMSCCSTTVCDGGKGQTITLAGHPPFTHQSNIK